MATRCVSDLLENVILKTIYSCISAVSFTFASLSSN
jgi:hypothetical protein